MRDDLLELRRQGLVKHQFRALSQSTPQVQPGDVTPHGHVYEWAPNPRHALPLPASLPPPQQSQPQEAGWSFWPSSAVPQKPSTPRYKLKSASSGSSKGLLPTAGLAQLPAATPSAAAAARAAFSAAGAAPTATAARKTAARPGFVPPLVIPKLPSQDGLAAARDGGGGLPATIEDPSLFDA